MHVYTNFNHVSEQYDKRREQPCHNMPDNTLDISDSDRTTYPVVVASYHSGAMTVLYNTTTKPLLERYAPCVALSFAPGHETVVLS